MRLVVPSASPEQPDSSKDTKEQLSKCSVTVPSSSIADDHHPHAFQGKEFCSAHSNEVLRLIMQTLQEYGYSEATQRISEETGLKVEYPKLQEFRKSVLNRDWAHAESLIKHFPLKKNNSFLDAAVMLREQMYIDAILDNNYDKALYILRTQIMPGESKSERSLSLPSLMMCSPAELDSEIKRALGDRYEPEGLLKALQNMISPSALIPPGRLHTLLQQALEYQIQNASWHNVSAPETLFVDFEASRSEFPSKAVFVCTEHTDEVWHVKFSHSGNLLASSSKDSNVIIWDPYTGKSVHVLSGHTQPVAYMDWSPDDKHIVTCSLDCKARLWKAETGECLQVFEEHTEHLSSCAWIDNDRFITGGMDLRLITWNKNGEITNEWKSNRTHDMAILPDKKRLITLCGKKFSLWEVETGKLICTREFEREISSVTVSKDENIALLNISSQEVQLWNFDTMTLQRKYIGQKQSQFVIRSCFGGANENFIMSGSESNIYIWRRETSRLLEELKGHTDTVNCISYSPVDPFLFASSGDDCTVRIWTTDPPRSSKLIEQTNSTNQHKISS